MIPAGERDQYKYAPLHDCLPSLSLKIQEHPGLLCEVRTTRTV
jgi:hypothetical protein